MSEKTMRCPFCDEKIMQGAEKCRYCKEWLISEDKISPSISSEDYTHESLAADDDPPPSISKENKKGKRFWPKFIVFLCIVAAVFVSAIYEKNAQEILKKSEMFQVNKKQDTALLGYKIVIEGFPFSYASIRAKEEFTRIKKSGNAAPDILEMRVKDTGNFDPYNYWAFPLAVSLGCGVIFAVMFILKLCFMRNPLPILFWAIISGAMFMVQLINSGEYKLDNRELVLFSDKLMSEPQLLFYVGYALIFVCVIVVLSPLRRVKTTS